ncbi:ribonuclease H-like domain-containing protein, partial [Tanacetum coccineum]
DFLTRRVLLRCDSIKELYPLTAPSPIPHAFLVSQHTWHQRLGHPGSDVLRRLVSNNVISCNKEKPHCDHGGEFDNRTLHKLLLIMVFNFAFLVLRHPSKMYLADGSLSRYKARLVANGNTQLEGVDVDETFSPVIKPGTIKTVLSLDASRHWPVYQLDVTNAFLHGDLSNTVYMHQPPGFRDSHHPDHVCLL